MSDPVKVSKSPIARMLAARSHSAGLNRLDGQNRVRVAARVRRMQLGNFGDSKSLRRGLYELRIDLGPGCRVYYGKDSQPRHASEGEEAEGDCVAEAEVVVLLVGGTKRRQNQDIEQACEYWRCTGR